MNPYIIDRPQAPNLVDAFSRGREQAQNYRMNQQSLADNDFKMGEAKRLQTERDAVIRIGSTLLKQTGGDVNKAQPLAMQLNPELAGPLSVFFQQIRGNTPDPIKMEQDKLKLQSEKNDLISDFGAPLAKQFLSRPQGEQLEGFADFANQLSQAGIPVPPEWTELGYTPEAVGQIQSLAGMGENQSGSMGNQPIYFKTQDGGLKIGRMSPSGIVFPELPEGVEPTEPLIRSDIGGAVDYTGSKTGSIVKTTTKTPKPLEEAKLGIEYSELDLKKQENERKAQLAIEKSKEFEEKHKTALFAKKQEVEKIDSFVDELEDLAKRPLGGNYGAGKVARIVPGSTWATTNAKINKLLSSGVLQVMAQLKASSPTGSTGFGALSEKEMAVLQSAFSILNDRNIEPEIANQEIKKILNITKKYRDNIKNYKMGESTENKDPLGLGIIE